MAHSTFIVAAIALAVAGCAAPPRPFPLRAPLTRDTDLEPVTIACRPDPSAKDPKRVRCAPDEYVPTPAWDHINNAVFEPISQALSVEAVGEAANANSMDEVANSAWFENRLGVRPMTPDEIVAAGCHPDDALPDEVADATWVIDRGKTDGASFGFRVDIPGKGKYMLKVEDPAQPEHANAAAVIGTAVYHAAGFNTTCEQVIYVRREQLKLTPGLTSIDNDGFTHQFGEAELGAGLARASKRGDRIRLTASKWLAGLTIGPFRYMGTRGDDPNDIIHHEHRRELRGSRLIAAWLNHWDARDQNSMDVWVASDAKHERSSPGYVRHYILDTSDVIGQASDPPEFGRRLGHSYSIDPKDVLLDFATFGILERPWDRAAVTPGHERFAYFSMRDFDPEGWKPSYPNGAFTRMTERDGAWMARIIARFTRPELAAIVGAGRFSNPSDTVYITDLLLARRQAILARYLTRLSPLADVREIEGRICAVDLARATAVLPAAQFRYDVVQQTAGVRTTLTATTGADGVVCFAPHALAAEALPDADPARRTVFEVRNGTAAGPLEIHAFDLGARGMRIVGLRRPAP